MTDFNPIAIGVGILGIIIGVVEVMIASCEIVTRQLDGVVCLVKCNEFLCVS